MKASQRIAGGQNVFGQIGKQNSSGSFIVQKQSTNIDGGVTKNHRRPECVWPEANKVCPSQLQKHSVKVGLDAKTQREHKPHRKKTARA